jgi:phosphoenolpyruvate---glycerone phosphotransferase subunit DhaM
MVGLVIVSHSRLIADGLHEMVSQVAGPEVHVATAGGTEDGRLGTSAPLIEAAILSADSPDGVLVLLDLGSAALSLELALESLPPELRSRVVVSQAPLVEGAVLAGVQASLGDPLAAVAAAAAGATGMSKLPGG